MILYGYIKQFEYSAGFTAKAQVRIPNIHGPYDQADAKGRLLRNYTRDEDLPWYDSVVLPHEPADGEVVILQSLGGENSGNYIVTGYAGT